MINSIYTGLTIALMTALFVLGMLFHNLRSSIESPVFRKALRMMVFTYCFFGLVNLLELWSRTFVPDIDDILLFQITTLIVAVLQAFLFTFALVLLIRGTYVTRKRMLRELILILTFLLIFVTACFILPTAWLKISVYLFTLFYVYLLISYTRLFVITYRECLRKMDNFFSGREAEHLSWVNISFYAALSIGVLALTASLFPDIYVGIVCSVIYLVFYLYFAFRFVKYGFVYEKLEKALSNDNIQPELPEEDKNGLPFLITKPLENNLKVWLDEKQFLQSGVTIEDVASKIGTNRSYLSEHINSNIGKTFRQWINELRIDEAKNWMRQYPEMTLNEIASHVGYTDKSNFIRQFKQLTSATPNEWRKNQT
jgi:AraC-like DNA-binding protein